MLSSYHQLQGLLQLVAGTIDQPSPQSKIYSTNREKNSNELWEVEITHTPHSDTEPQPTDHREGKPRQ